jgi:hypothetical protein
MTTPEEAARRILEPPKKERPTIEELEAILAAPDGPPVTINPDGSIGVGESDAVIVARALLASASSRAAVVEECGKRLDEEAATEDSMVKVMANNRMYGVAANHQTAASFFRHAAELVRALKGGAA